MRWIAGLLSFTMIAPIMADEELPIALKLIVNEAPIKLDRMGKSAEQYMAYLKDVPRKPNAPKVGWSLQLRNRSRQNVQVWKKGDPVRLELKLKGAGAVTVIAQQIFTREFRLPTVETLKPGQSVKISLESLQFGFRMAEKRAYFTEAGSCKVTAELQTGIKPPPPNRKVDRQGFARVTLKSEAVTIKVVE